MSCTFIAIAGASASGKTLLAQTVYQELQRDLGTETDVAILAEDAYYQDQNHLDLAQRASTNYDHPNAFDHELLMQHLHALNAGQSIQVPNYDFSLHTRTKTVHHMAPPKVVLIEGILLLHDPKLRELFDMKVFVDTPMDICLLRRIERDMHERGRSLDSVVNQYRATVRPMYHEFIAPSKVYADLVITRGGKNRIAIDVLKQKIAALLNTP